ncbi:hypothetical protein ACH4VT_37155 [Streptomyces lydicus]|uniref:hypothetical protein n=1 Tax=Streptomyces lydicus TaxID=47763 RepID=UPI003788395B
MTRHPPAIKSVVPTDGGDLDVEWSVDDFFPDSESPDKVRIDLNGKFFRELEGSSTEVQVPKSAILALGAPEVSVSVSFFWDGSPSQELQTTAPAITVNGGAPATGGGLPPPPRVRIDKVQGRTLHSEPSITLSWASFNYNDANIFWGTVSQSPQFKVHIPPHGDVYHGTFTTDRPLLAGELYVFDFQVRNTMLSPTWFSTKVAVRVPANISSVRKFMKSSGLPASTNLRSFAGSGQSVRQLLFGNE